MERLGSTRIAWIAVISAALWLAGCSARSTENLPLSASPPPPRAEPAPSGAHVTLASWYGPGFNGQRTASGEVYHQGDLTAASRTLPLGSRVRVTDLRSGRSVVVRINDRGPYVHGRGIDLSQRAAQRIGLNHCGVARVSVSPLGTTRAAAPDTGSEADLTDARPRHHQGTGYARRRYSEYSAGRARHRSRRIVTNPVGHWLMAVMR